MTIRWPLFLAAGATIAGYCFWNQQTAAQAVRPSKQDCHQITFEKKRFTECIAIPGRHRIQTKITGSSGIIYRSFGSLALDVDRSRVVFAFNGGMYDTGSKPIGYYVEAGERLYQLNTRDAAGNFYLKPNGVFFGDATGNWRVMTSEDFAAKVFERPFFGTQSGPMLLIGGRIHPKISANGTSLKIRNGVGVDEQGRAHFVISDDPVSFGTLARMMRDHARTPDALFLDGTVSALWHPASKRRDARYPLGPLILVTSNGRT